MDFTLRPWTNKDLESVFEAADNNEIVKYMSDGFPNTLKKWESFIEFATKEKTVLYLAIENGKDCSKK